MSSMHAPLFENSPYFRWRYLPRRRLLRGLLDPVILADLLLLVGLFLFAHSTFVLKPAVRMNLPESVFAAGTRYGSLVVTLTQENLVFFNDERTTLNGLRSAFAQAAFEDADAVLVVEADGRVPHRTVVSIYNMAIEAGLREVAVVTRVSGGGGER